LVEASCAVARIKLTDPAKADIAEALRFTFLRFGESTAREYKELIDEAQQ
jgi:plasmid stabilization system protein ParE